MGDTALALTWAARDFHTKEELLLFAKGFVLAMGCHEFYSSWIEAFETVEATRKVAVK
jgi:hypothetical protein